VLEKAELCRADPEEEDALEKGGMNGLFERMIRVAEEMGFEPKVWSRPENTTASANNYAGESERHDTDEGGDTTTSCENDSTNNNNSCNTSDGPWVITLENFLSSEEISTLLKWGAERGYDRSQAGDAVVDVRTSSHAWCLDGCHDDPVVAALRRRIEGVTSVPQSNYESFQLLKYEVGQFYKPHNDFIEKHAFQRHGPRILTFFMYFDEVEEGGGTQFPELNNLTIEPKKGRVLIWPSVLDENPYEEDRRTDHEALEVTKGYKFAANAWIHMRDFQKTLHLDCDS